jgi:hypothetical protein
MTYDEFDSLYLSVREQEQEPVEGFRRVLVSPTTYQALRECWSWAGAPPRSFEASTRVNDHQIGIER